MQTVSLFSARNNPDVRKKVSELERKAKRELYYVRQLDRMIKRRKRV
jgi:hypothetical protein